MDEEQIFNIVIFVFAAFVLGETIANVYHYQSMYNGGGTPKIGKTSCLVMLILNIIILVVTAALLIWVIVRIFSHQN